jgi:spore germination protein YaaH
MRICLQMRQCLIAVTLGVPLVAAPVRHATAQRPEALWYSVGGEQSTQSFLAHADRISVVAPQVFSLDSAGVISGGVDPRVVAAARQHHVQLIPLVMNPGFNQAAIHRVLNTPEVGRRAVRNLAALCRDQHFDGLQFDLENVNVVDRDALTKFVRESAAALHAVHCTLSAAVVPRTSDNPGPTSFHRWIFENWRGVYDYKALADALDFISYMTYAQHTGGTTPGPVAGYTWMEQALQFVLSTGVPPAKISIGIPSYSDWWYPTYDSTAGSRVRGSDISYAAAMGILARHDATLTWDDREKSSWSMWSDDGVNEFLWLEDARSFAAKMALVRKYHLRGYSVWVLGMEDPRVWTADMP